MLAHSAQSAWALRFWWGLKAISPTNRLRLWRKSVHLYASFLAFTDRERPALQLRRAMVCAVLSAVYDYDTDWVKTEHPESSLTFQELDRLLDDHPNRDEAITIAQTLFRLDWDGRLSADGLERGSYALHFYWLVIESRWMSAYTADEIKLFGRKLQIVDDLYDLEKDRHSGDKNCFHIGKSWRYAREGREFLESDFFHALEENSPIYRLIREHCQKKLDHMHL